MTQWMSHSVSDTEKIAHTLAALLKPGGILALCGDLGAGKTTIVQQIVQQLHGTAQGVNSPTFALLNIYDGTPPVYHMDWYRLANRATLDAMGLEEYVDGQGICLIEWGDRFADYLPSHTLWLRILLQSDGTRTLTLEESCSV